MADDTTTPQDDELLPELDGEQDDATLMTDAVDGDSAPADEVVAAALDAVDDSADDVSADDDIDADDDALLDDDDELLEDDEADLDDEAADDDDILLDDEYSEDDVETSPVASVDWTALAMAGESVGTVDVPDLTMGDVNPMDVDIDAALAAVDSLGAVVAAEQERKREEADRREAQRRADEEYRRWAESYVFRRPGMIRVQGGRVVTILPAVALMAVGAVLTLATTSGQAMSWYTLAAAASAGLSVSLLSYWLASGRWARGALFAALAVAIAGGWVFLSATDIELSWTVPFAATGAAFALTGLLGRPRAVPWIVTGLGMIVGVVALPFLSVRALTTAAPFVLAAAVILAILPAIFRVRRS